MSRPPLTPSFLRVRDVATLLGVSAGTVYTLCRDGALPTVRIGKAVLIPRRDFDAYQTRLLNPGPIAFPQRGRPKKVGAL